MRKVLTAACFVALGGLFVAGRAAAGEALTTEAELYRLVPKKAAMVALFNVPAWDRLDRAYALRGGRFDVTGNFQGSRSQISAAIAVLRPRSNGCAVVLKCPGGSDALFKKMLAKIKTWTKGGRTFTSPKPGVHLLSGIAFGCVLTKLSDKHILWSVVDDAEGGWGLEVKKWYDSGAKAGKHPPWLSRLVRGSEKRLISWAVPRPKEFENEGVCRVLPRLKKSAPRSIEGQVVFAGGKVRETAIYRFADAAGAAGFLKESKGEHSLQRKVITEFSIPWQYFLERELRDKAPRQFPDKVEVEGATITTRREVALPKRRKAGA
jgi:hypothetical protein